MEDPITKVISATSIVISVPVIIFIQFIRPRVAEYQMVRDTAERDHKILVAWSSWLADHQKAVEALPK